MRLESPPATKTVTHYEFYYLDQRAGSATAFAANSFVYDPEAGDVIDVTGPADYPDYRLTKADGRMIHVPPKWRWMEKREAVVKIKP
jgi:hypothetical protein